MEPRLAEIVADVFRVRKDAIADDTRLDQLETWDSLRQMEFVLTVERVFGIQLSAQEIYAMRRIDEVRRILQSKGVGA